MKRIKKRGSFASYPDKSEKGWFKCDLDELAEALVKWADIPEYLNNTRAMEIGLLATAYLKYRDNDKDRLPRKKRKK